MPQNVFDEFDDMLSTESALAPTATPSMPEPDGDVFADFDAELSNYEVPGEPVSADEDPTWGDYGRMVMAGGAQVGAGIGWLASKMGMGEGLLHTGQDAAEWWMEGLSDQAKAALQVEFTKRDRGELWTDSKWNKAKLSAMQSLLGTMAGMGVGGLFTKGLGATGLPGMTRTVTMASGGAVQVPSRAAGMIGYGAGEAAIAAPSVGAEVEHEILGMSHAALMDNSIEYRALYDGLEKLDPAERERQAKETLAAAAAGDATALAFLSTFVLSAPFGTLMGKMTQGLPLTQGGGRLMGGVRGATGEAGQEFLQSGAEAFATNVGVRQADETRPLTENMLEHAVGGALAGGIMGAGPGLAARPDTVAGETELEDEESPLAAVAKAEVDDIDARDIDPTTGEPVPRIDRQKTEAVRDDYGRVTQQVVESEPGTGLGYEEGFEDLPETRDELDIAMESVLLELELAGAEQEFIDDLAAEGVARAQERQGSRNMQMLEMEQQRADQLAKMRQPADVDELSELAEALDYYQNEVDTYTQALDAGGVWVVNGEVQGIEQQPDGSIKWTEPEEVTEPVVDEKGEVVGEQVPREFQEWTRGEIRNFESAREDAQKAVDGIKVRMEYEQARTTDKAAQEEEAYRQRELQIADEGAQREGLTREADEILPGPTGTPAINPENQLEVQRGLGGGGDLSGRPVELDQRTTETLASEPRGEEQAPSSMTTPGLRGEPVYGEPIDVVGGIPVEGREEGVITPWGVNPAGGRPSGTSVGEALRAAQRAAGSDKGPTDTPTPPAGPAGAPVASEPKTPTQTPPTATQKQPERRVAPEPVVGYVDHRMRDMDHRDALERMRDEIYAGGAGMGTLMPDQNYMGGESDKRNDDGSYEVPMKKQPSMNPSWFQNWDKRGMTVEGVQNLINKMLEGKRLGSRQKEMAAELLDMASSGIEEDAMLLAEQKAAQAEEEAAQAEAEEEARLEREAIQAEAEVAPEEEYDDDIPFDPIEKKNPAAKELDEFIAQHTDTQGLEVSAETRNKINSLLKDVEFRDRDEYIDKLDKIYGPQIGETETISFKSSNKKNPDATAEIDLVQLDKNAWVIGISHSYSVGTYAGGSYGANVFWNEVHTSREAALRAGLENLQAQYQPRENTSSLWSKGQEKAREQMYDQITGELNLLGPAKPERFPGLERQDERLTPEFQEAEAEAEIEAFQLESQKIEEEAIDQQALVEEIQDDLDGKEEGYRNSTFFDEEDETFEMADIEDALTDNGWESDMFGAEEGFVYTKNGQMIVIQEHDLEGQYTIHWYGGREAAEQEGPDKSIPADLGRPGDLFSAQVDIEDQTGKPEIDALADELENTLVRIEDVIYEGLDDRNMIMADLRRLKLNKHPRADEFAALIKQIDEGWSLAVDKTYPSGQRDVTVTDSLGNETSLTLMEGEGLDSAVEIVQEGREAEESRPTQATGTVEGKTTSLPELAARELEDEYATKKLTPIQKDALRVATRLALDSEHDDNRFSIIAFVNTEIIGSGEVGETGQAVTKGMPTMNTVRQLEAKGVLVPVEESRRPNGSYDYYRVPNIPESGMIEAPGAAISDSIEGIKEGPESRFALENLARPAKKLSDGREVQYTTKTVDYGDGLVSLKFQETTTGTNVFGPSWSKKIPLKTIIKALTKNEQHNLTKDPDDKLSENEIENGAMEIEQIEYRDDGTGSIIGRVWLPDQEMEDAWAFEFEWSQEGGQLPSPGEINTAANEAATSPQNDLPQPTEAQKKAGNYKKGHIRFLAFDVTIENPIGSKRFGNMKMRDHYGYIKGTQGADEDQIDVFVNEGAQPDFNGTVYIVDQLVDGKAKGGFDEHKVMLGYKSKLDAIRAYKRNYTKGWVVGPITEMSMSQFMRWTAESGANTKPAAESEAYNDPRLRHKKESRDEYYEVGSDVFNAPTQSWLDQLLGDSRLHGDVPDTTPTNILVERLLALEESSKALDEQLEPKSQPKSRESEYQGEVDRINEAFPEAQIQFIESKDFLSAVSGNKSPTMVERIKNAFDTMFTTAVFDMDTDTIFVFKDRIRSMEHLRRTVAHEMFHKGLSRAMGPQMNPVLDDFYANMDSKQRVEFNRIAKVYNLDKNDQQDRREIVEEMLAFYAERGRFGPEVKGFMDRMIQAVREWLAQFGLSSEANPWSDADVRQLIAEANGSLARRRDSLAGKTYEEEVVLDETGEVFVVEMDAQVEMSAVQKRRDACERIKKCMGR